MFVFATPYAIINFVTAALVGIVLVMIWRRRPAQASLPLFLLMLAALEWAFANGMEAAAVEQPLKIFWSQVGYLGAQTSPIFLLLFALQYSGRENPLKKWRAAFLFLIPIATILLAWTNEQHQLIWSNFSPGLAGTNSLIYNHGPGFWVSMVYIYLIVFIATLILVRTAIRSSATYRLQNGLVLFATIFPWASTIMYLTNLNPLPGLDLSPIGFMFSSIILALAMIYFRWMDLVPIARDLVVEQLSDGLVVLDGQRRIIDLNPTARKILRLNEQNWIGQPVDHVSPDWSRIGECLDQLHSGEADCVYDEQTDLFFTIRINPLHLNDTVTGWLVTLTDSTQAKKSETALQQTKKNLELQLKENLKLQKKLRFQAIRDLLTGLFNRRYLEETLSRELARANRDHQSLGLVMIDMDNLKKINDHFGHQAGDLVLKTVGKMLLAETRQGDIACRFGGDEFMIVLPGANINVASSRAEKWLINLTNLNISYKKEKIEPTFSAGVAVFPQHGADIKSLMRAADQALYRAKEEGRKRVKVSQ